MVTFATAWAPLVAVIPAKAGIHAANLRKCAVEGLDSRFRGNDLCFEREPMRNNTKADALDERSRADGSPLPLGVMIRWGRAEDLT